MRNGGKAPRGNGGDSMIRRLRLQVVAVCMLLVTAILAVVFATVYFSAARNIERTATAVLVRVMEEESVPFLPGASADVPEFGSGRVQMPYFTVQVWGDNTVYVTGGTYDDLENTETLASILNDCLAQKEDQGLLLPYHLRYLRQENALFTKIAFVDISMERATLRALIASCFQIGLAAMALLLGVSVLLSFWVTRPVERAWRQQRRFLSDASHELKTPLTVILSNAELMESTPLPEKQARWTDNIHSEARRMRALVEEMLTLARADDMVRATVFSAVNLTDVAEDCALSFEPVAFEAGDRLTYDLPPEVTVQGDGEKLRQVVSILLDNAVKYGRPGGEIALTLQRTDRQVRLQVSNENAAGPIPPEQLDRLFERFYRADASRGEQSGFGLGLPIAAAIAREHKGTLKAESDQRGTRFTLILPVKR